MTIITCAACGRIVQHEARGIGRCCYEKIRRRGLLAGFAKGRRAPPRKSRADYYREYKYRAYVRSRKAAA